MKDSSTTADKKIKKSSKLGSRNNLVAYSFILPNFIGFAIFTLVPMIFSLVLSFAKWKGTGKIEFVWLDNFTRLFRDEAFIRALFNTVIYTLFTVPGTMVAALALAMLLNSKIKARNLFRTVYFFPYVASLVAVATVWRFMFSPQVGPINMLLSQIMAEGSTMPAWTSAPGPAMFLVVFFSVWKNMGYYMVIYLAGLQNVNTELYESAALDGANDWQRFKHVTIPQISPTTFFVLMMLVISSFKAYDIFLNLFAGGDNQLSSSTRVIVYQIYNTAFRGLDYGYASAMSIILFLIVLIVTLVQFKGEKKYGSGQ
ncbi:MAG: sugar ABC transporter permease [Clostridiaceae bacterium]|nr:sugar ABC transporter permease [Clostridiaceae bacterium]